jgi:hypothetical protein
MSPKTAPAEQPSPVPEPAEANALATQLEAVSTALVKIDKVAAGIADLRAKYGSVVFDVTTVKGMKEACEARAEIREPRYEVERLRKAAKRPILDLGKKLDTEAERITNELLAIENPLDLQITAEQTRKEDEKKAREEAERKRIEDIHSRIENDIRQAAFAATNRKAAEIEVLIKDVVAIEINESFAEFRQQAEGAKATTLIRLRAALANAQAMEAEQARLAAERAENERVRKENEAKAATERARIAEEERVAREAREQEAAELRAAAELNQMRMSEIQGIQQQVIIAQCGRLGVRQGGTIECIRDTLAETEVWPIEETGFGPMTGMAQAAKDQALTAIRELLAAAQARAAEDAEAAAERQRIAEENFNLQARREEQEAESARLAAEHEARVRKQAEADAVREAEAQRITDAREQLERDQAALKAEREKPTADVVPLPQKLMVGEDLPEVSVTVGGESIPSTRETTAEADYIDIVFDGPPSHESGRFVEVEDASGKSISAGEWIERPDKLWALRIPRPLEVEDDPNSLLTTIRLTEYLPMESVCKFAKEWAVFQERDSKLDQKKDRKLAAAAREAEANLLAVVEQLP